MDHRKYLVYWMNKYFQTRFNSYMSRLRNLASHLNTWRLFPSFVDISYKGVLPVYYTITAWTFCVTTPNMLSKVLAPMLKTKSRLSIFSGIHNVLLYALYVHRVAKASPVELLRLLFVV